jgi:hypothetical protein
MPVGNIKMSDGKEGAVPPRAGHVPEGLTQPYDGGLAFKSREVATTRFSHHPSVGTARASLRLPDGDAAASYTSDATVLLTNPLPAKHAPGVRGRPPVSKRHVAAPWAFTGDAPRLAEAGMGGARVHTVTYADGRSEPWAGAGSDFAAGLLLTRPAGEKPPPHYCQPPAGRSGSRNIAAPPYLRALADGEIPAPQTPPRPTSLSGSGSIGAGTGGWVTGN